MLINRMELLDSTFRSLYQTAKIMLGNGKKVTVEVTEFKAKRSNAANNYYWLFNAELSEFLNLSGLSYGEHQLPYTAELIHEINKKLFGVKSTKKMSVGEFCEYMNKLLFFWQDKTAGEFQMSELPANYLYERGIQ